MTKWLTITILFLMLISYSIVSTLIAFKLDARIWKLERQVLRTEEKIDVLEDNQKHFLHRLNAFEYPEVLGKSKKYIRRIGK